MRRTNCPNCGAPTTPNAKCEYCGTYFFDLAHVPLNEPFYLSVNLGTEEHPRVITERVNTSGCKLTREPLYDASARDLDDTFYWISRGTATKYEFEFISY